MDRETNSAHIAQQRSQSVATFAAVAIVGFVVLLLLGGAVVGFIAWRQWAMQAELANLSQAMADLDASYAQTTMVTAVDLTTDYRFDELIAADEYGGTLLEIEGTIAAIDADAQTIDLAGGKSGDGVELLVRVELSVTSAEAESIFYRTDEQTPYRLGNTIRLRGYAGEFADGVLAVEHGSPVAK